MEELQVINHNNVDVIDSREVAEMIGKDHRHLIRDIRGYTEILKNTTEPNFGLNTFSSRKASGVFRVTLSRAETVNLLSRS